MHVLALREIVTDVGADRGIIMAENGYQKGAHEAAQLTNVQLSSLAELSITARGALDAVQLHLLHERIDKCRDRYWELDKETRIKYGLRPPMYTYSDVYSSTHIIQGVKAAINAAVRGRIPLDENDTMEVVNRDLSDKLLALRSTSELIDLVTPMIAGLEERLDTAYRAIDQNPGTGKPNCHLIVRGSAVDPHHPGVAC